MPRPQLTEGTQVVVGLGHVVGGILALALAFGGWLWHLQELVYEVRQDVAVVKAQLVPVATKPRPSGYPAWPFPDPPPVALLGPPLPDATRRSDP